MMPIAVTECILYHIFGPVSHILGKVDELMCSVEEDMVGLVSSRDPLLLEQMINRHAFVVLKCDLQFQVKRHFFLLRYWDHPVLHPNHYLVVELCHSLVFAYAVLRLVDF